MTISLANQKGGVGKTTTCLNLAVYLSRLGKKVLLIDLDPQGNLSSGGGISRQLASEKSIYKVISDQLPASEAKIPLPGTEVHIIPAGIDLAGAEVELVNRMSRESIVRDALADIVTQYDLVLIDCPPSLGLLTINALVASDRVLIPVQSEYYALEGLGLLLDTVKLVKRKLNSRLELLGIAITMYDSRTNLSKDVLGELVKAFDKKVFETIIPRNIKLSEAPSHGKPIQLYAERSLGALSYQSLAEEVAGRL
jgi:chromosome partitioning protein